MKIVKGFEAHRKMKVKGKDVKQISKKHPNIIPIAEVMRESSNTQLDLKSKDMRDSVGTKFMSNHYETDE